MALINSKMVMSEVVKEAPSLIPVIQRFGIRLGLGDYSVKQVCNTYGLDCDFFLVVVNTYLNEDYFPEQKLHTFHHSLIVDYLRKTNLYYLRHQLPNIERHLTGFISMSQSENQSIVLMGKFFHSFKEELSRRIEHDEDIWFPNCLNGCKTPPKEEQEDSIEALLGDLINILVKHLSGEYNENLCYAVIFAITALEKDIKKHNRIRRLIQ